MDPLPFPLIRCHMNNSTPHGWYQVHIERALTAIRDAGGVGSQLLDPQYELLFGVYCQDLYDALTLLDVEMRRIALVF